MFTIAGLMIITLAEQYNIWLTDVKRHARLDFSGLQLIVGFLFDK